MTNKPNLADQIKSVIFTKAPELKPEIAEELTIEILVLLQKENKFNNVNKVFDGVEVNAIKKEGMLDYFDPYVSMKSKKRF